MSAPGSAVPTSASVYPMATNEQALVSAPGSPGAPAPPIKDVVEINKSIEIVERSDFEVEHAQDSDLQTIDDDSLFGDDLEPSLHHRNTGTAFSENPQRATSTPPAEAATVANSIEKHVVAVDQTVEAEQHKATSITPESLDPAGRRSVLSLAEQLFPESRGASLAPSVPEQQFPPSPAGSQTPFDALTVPNPEAEHEAPASPSPSVSPSESSIYNPPSENEATAPAKHKRKRSTQSSEPDDDGNIQEASKRKMAKTKKTKKSSKSIPLLNEDDLEVQRDLRKAFRKDGSDGSRPAKKSKLVTALKTTKSIPRCQKAGDKVPTQSIPVIREMMPREDVNGPSLGANTNVFNPRAQQLLKLPPSAVVKSNVISWEDENDPNVKWKIIRKDSYSVGVFGGGYYTLENIRKDPTWYADIELTEHDKDHYKVRIEKMTFDQLEVSRAAKIKQEKAERAAAAKSEREPSKQNRRTTKPKTSRITKARATEAEEVQKETAGSKVKTGRVVKPTKTKRSTRSSSS